MRKSIPIPLLILALGSVQSGRAFTTFFDNLANGYEPNSPGSQISVNSIAGNIVAVGFTPTNSGLFFGIEVALSKFSGADNLRISLADDGGGQPGTQLDVLSENDSGWQSGFPLLATRTLASTNRPTLTSGSQYWLIFEPTDTTDSFYSLHEPGMGMNQTTPTLFWQGQGAPLPGPLLRDPYSDT
ncbi:MAG: choice-of-anchor R domain-containing protein, partial [Verrucomicrobiota bacterium]